VRHLADQRGNTIYFITQPNENVMRGVFKVSYPKDERGAINCHAYSVEVDRSIYNGTRVADACRQLVELGFKPDLIVGHSGWGETLFVKDVFPDVPLLANFEFYYHAKGVDVDFDPEFVSIFNDASRLRTLNATNLLSFQGASWGHSATAWQRSLYPPEMQPRISQIHEGVDTEIARPNPRARFTLPGSGRVLTQDDEVVTYVARNLEPYRGFHVFMRSLPQLLRRRKNAQVVIVGADGVSYGGPTESALRRAFRSPSPSGRSGGLAALTVDGAEANPQGHRLLRDRPRCSAQLLRCLGSGEPFLREAAQMLHVLGGPGPRHSSFRLCRCHDCPLQKPAIIQLLGVFGLSLDWRGAGRRAFPRCRRVLAGLRDAPHTYRGQ